MRASPCLLALALAACGPSPSTALDGGAGAGGGGDLGRADLIGGGGGADLAFDGSIFRYVTNRITLPRTPTDYAFSVHGDGFPRNQLGRLADALAQKNLPLQPAQTLAVTVDGDGLALLALGTRDEALASDAAAFVRVFVADPQVGPDFSGDGTFRVHPNFAGGRVEGRIAAGVFVAAEPATRAAPPAAPLRLALGATSRATLPLVGAHLRVTPTPSGATMGEIHGALRAEDVEAVLIPALAANLTLLAQQPDCAQVAECRDVRALFDTGPVDGRVDALEVKTSPHLAAALALDLDLYDERGAWAPNPRNAAPDAWSLGVGFTAVRARFTEPP